MADMFLLLFFIFIIMSSCCYGLFRKRRGAVLSAPVQVTAAAHAVPSGYTVTHVRPTATGYQTQTYSTPYPPLPIPSIRMPMPMSATQSNATLPPLYGTRSEIAPYPTMNTADINPPAYHVAVTGSGTTGETSKTIYEKQLPYNPGFQK